MNIHALYAWKSDLLKGYRRGVIVVCADGVEHAREVARRGFDVWVDQQIQEYFYDDDDVFQARVKFEADIAKVPEVSDGKFIYGGD